MQTRADCNLLLKEGDTLNRLNEENYNSCGTLMKIVEYITADNIIVEFQDEYKFRKKTTYSNFKMGRVKNPYDKTVFGIGYLGNGIHKSWKNARGSRDTYLNWIAMLQRCYVDMGDKYLSYYGFVTVCDEWLNFQNFAEWYESNYYYIPNERLHIDKDMKSKESKVYSPDTCILIPQSINEVVRDNYRDSENADLPVTIKRCGDKYQVKFRRENLGKYNTVKECLNKYNNRKISYIKELTEGYGDLLPNDVKEVVLQWRP